MQNVKIFFFFLAECIFVHTQKYHRLSFFQDWFLSFSIRFMFNMIKKKIICHTSSTSISASSENFQTLVLRKLENSKNVKFPNLFYQGWCITLLGVMLVLLFFLHSFLKHGVLGRSWKGSGMGFNLSLKGIFSPLVRWGPRNPLDRLNWIKVGSKIDVQPETIFHIS